MSPAIHPDYRPDIDGLRSIAVLLVLFFHAGYSVFSGGFVGVDVFFVISGYLITQVIVKNVDAEKFSYRNFYLRRINRLAPAFFTVVATSFVLAYHFMLPEDFLSHLKLMPLSIVSLGNFYIANTTEGYFAESAESIPLLHTWSLSVEEQFYFFWPVTLVLLLRYVRRERMPLLLTALLVLWLAFSQWYTLTSPTRAYYLLPARIFELMMGAALVFAGDQLRRRTPPLVATLIAVLGVVLIVISALTLSKDSAFPGVNALWPCLGTALLIYFGGDRNRVSQLLARGVFVWVGKISYSLYLWHWVVFTFYRYAYGELVGSHRIFCIVVAVLLAWLTWIFIENPFRFRFRLRFRTALGALVLAPLVVFAAAHFYIDKRDGLPERFGDTAYARILLNEKPADVPQQCDDDTAPHCGEVLLLGDSHALHYVEFLNVLTRDAGLSLLNAAKAGCPPVYGATLVMTKSRGAMLQDPYQCRDYVDQHFDQLGRHQYVVISSYWELIPQSLGRYHFVQGQQDALDIPTSQRVLAQGLRAAIAKVVASGATPVMILDLYTVTPVLHKCSQRKVTFGYSGDCSFAQADLLQQQQESRAMLADLQNEFPTLQLIDPNMAVCDGGRCETIIDNMPIYHDLDHLHWFASREIGKIYLQKAANPFQRKDVDGTAKERMAAGDKANSVPARTETR